MTVPCQECKGTGRVWIDVDRWDVNHYTTEKRVDCPECWGTGTREMDDPEEGEEVAS